MSSIKVLSIDEQMKDLCMRARNIDRFWLSIKAYYRFEYYREPYGDYVCDDLSVECGVNDIQIFNIVERFKGYLIANNILDIFINMNTVCILINNVLFIKEEEKEQRYVNW